MGSFNLTDLTMMKSRLESGGLVRMEDPSEELAGREGGTFSDKESETVTSLLPAAAGSAAPLPRKGAAYDDQYLGAAALLIVIFNVTSKPNSSKTSCHC